MPSGCVGSSRGSRHCVRGWAPGFFELFSRALSIVCVLRQGLQRMQTALQPDQFSCVAIQHASERFPVSRGHPAGPPFANAASASS